VTDENSWASPGASEPVSPPPFAAPFAGQQPPQFPGQPGAAWAPPPRPGLIPLAPMTLGTILGAAFRVLRRNPRPIVGFSLVIHGIIAIATIFVTTYALTTITHTTQLLDQPDSAISTSDATSQIGGLLVAVLAEFGAAALMLVGTQILQGIVSVEVARGTVGEKLPLRALWARARGRILVLVGWSFALVAALIVFTSIVFGLIILLVALAAAGNGNGGLILLAVLGSIVLGVGGVVVAIWVGTKLSFVPSALVIERLTLGRAMRRSWRLTGGFFWRTFGILLLVSVMISIASQIVESPVALIGSLLSGAANPTGSSLDSLTDSLKLTQVVSAIVGAIVSTVTAIISTSVSTLLYLDLRIRKEGLDLQLMRFVDARQAGQTDVPDPYVGAVDPGIPPMAPAGQFAGQQYGQGQYSQPQAAEPQYGQPAAPPPPPDVPHIAPPA
jgi:hypothetical protein